MGHPFVTATDDDGRCRLIVDGEFDLALEEGFVACVAELLGNAASATVVVDLGGVEFIDSSGVRALLRVVLDHPGRVQLGPVSPSVEQVLSMAGVEKAFESGSSDH